MYAMDNWYKKMSYNTGTGTIGNTGSWADQEWGTIRKKQ